MPLSRLDQVDRISNNFNASADVALEKKVSQYQLTKEEQQERFDLAKARTEKEQQEKQGFEKPEERKKRFDEKYAELAEKHNTLKPELTPPGMGNKPIPRHQLMNMAETEVNRDHTNRLKSYETEYQKGMQTVLDRAAQNGRGPQRQNRDDQNRGHDQDRSQDNNRDRERD